ncbi:MAG: hypothetical protein HYT81_11435 [Gemmatimonadetes bacterium]|nr:hypothetical protein [Gemmatimonadota bacterium]
MSSRRVQVRLIAHSGTLAEPSGAPVVSRMPDNDRLVIHAPGSVALADAARADGIIYAAPSLIATPDRLAEAILDPVVLLLVTADDRVPIHAALVGRHRVAVLLAAASGTGKSTLAYAALRSGCRVSADDVVYVQMEPRFRVWGAGRALRVPVEARRWFAELTDLAPVAGPDGEEKLLVALVEAEPSAPVAERTAVCLLRRAGAAPGLRRVDPPTVAAALRGGLEPGFDRFADRLDRVVERLSEAGGFQLDLSSHPRDALPYIERMLAELEAQP